MNTALVNRTFISKPGEGQVLLAAGLRLKVGTSQNGGSFELFEIAGTGTPPAHVHRDTDHCFYIIAGSFTFIVGEEEMEASADTVVFVPRGIPHAYKHSEGARALCFVIPAQLEGYFRELQAGREAGRAEPDLLAELAGKYDSWPAR